MSLSSSSSNVQSQQEIVNYTSHQQCAYCSKTTGNLKCTRCKVAYYCDKNCQIKHWKAGHKTKCVSPEKAHAEMKKKKINPDISQCEHCEVEEITSGMFKSCGRCKMVKYCSKECQAAHWKSKHKKECIPTEQRRVPQEVISSLHLQEKYFSIDKLRLGQEMVTNHPCAICLEEVSSEIDCVLGCSHIFHAPCLSQLRAVADSAQQLCPLCRSDLPPGPEDSFNQGFNLLEKINFFRPQSFSPPHLSKKKKVIAETAIRFLNDAADEGFLKAIELLYSIFLHGPGNIRDPSKAAVLAFKSAKQGDVDAQAFCGRLLYNGMGVAKNQEQAEAWFRMAAEQGHADAQYCLGVLLSIKAFTEDAEGAWNEKKEIAGWFQKAAEQGHVESQCCFGLMLDIGEGVTKNPKQAAAWYLKAARQEHADAQQRLGVMLLEGEGVTKNPKQGLAWLKKAAEQGNEIAQVNLGMLFVNGKGVLFNPTQAVAWFRKAAEQGNVDAQFRLGVLFIYGKGMTKNQKEAVVWFRKAAEQGNVDAQFRLGAMIFKGDGVTKDQKQAVTWFRKAAEQGHVDAQFQLGAMILNGDGVTKDQEQAHAWFKKAAEQGNARAQLFVLMKELGAAKEYKVVFTDDENLTDA